VTATEAGPALAEELRRRRMALGWTLEQVAEQAQVSVGMLSLIETGKRRPSLHSWERIKGALGISEPLPEEAWRQRPREISDELVAALSACLAVVRQVTLAELAEATCVSISDVRLALRRPAEQLESAGMQVLDDGSQVQLAPEKRFPVPAGRAGRAHQPAADLAGLAFVIASSAALPVILFTLFWKRFNTWDAVAGLLGGTAATILSYVLGVNPPKNPMFPLANVGIVTIPFGFLCAVVFTYLGALVGADRLAERVYHEIDVRANTGAGRGGGRSRADGSEVTTQSSIRPAPPAA
jgi:transcriptional regulator with XRE-family HTH domain